MIILKRKEEVFVYQLSLTLKRKTKQSPFISILILASEMQEITPYSLQQNLLSPLPLRACSNLLKRLEQQGFLEANFQRNQPDNAIYTLTNQGEQNAIDKSYWLGEKGEFNIYISNSTLIPQQVIKIEKTDRKEDKDMAVCHTPYEIKFFEKKPLQLLNSEIQIEEIEDKCFRLPNVSCSMEVHASDKTGSLKVIYLNEPIYQNTQQITKASLQQDILLNCPEFEYDSVANAIRTSFNEEDISFKRNVSITNPVHENIIFDSVEIDNILHIPATHHDAELWLTELIFRGINTYFLDDNSFELFAQETAKPLLAHYELDIPGRSQFLEILAAREDAFYQSARLNTIDYLTY